jgi:zinc/manganese transport system substrate-binding protein
MSRYPILAAFAVMLAPALPGWAGEPVNIVAAENFYGDVAQQIGGPAVKVSSILSNPDQDPHLFEASPSVAKDISAASIAVYSGIDYDPWMEKLLSAAKSSHRRTIDVAQLAARKTGDNPHVWYDPQTMLAYAAVLTEVLAAEDPDNAAAYRQRLSRFQDAMHPVLGKIAALRDRLAGTPVAATEPVFGYMFDALGMRSLNQRFQLAVMNNTEPSASDVAAFERNLRSHTVKLLIYNSQATDPTADRMESIAKQAGVPVVGATETMPSSAKSYQDWMLSELDAVDKALSGQAR